MHSARTVPLDVAGKEASLLGLEKPVQGVSCAQQVGRIGQKYVVTQSSLRTIGAVDVHLGHHWEGGALPSSKRLDLAVAAWLLTAKLQHTEA